MKVHKGILVASFLIVYPLAANAATISFEWRAADGATPITVVDMGINGDFTLAVGGSFDAGETGVVRLYDHDEFGDNVADMMGMVIIDYASIPPIPDPSYDGFDINWGGTEPYSGDIALISCEALATGIFTVDSLAGDYITVIDSVTIEIIPEPMTIALLGLGGLLLRRRKR